MHQIPNWLQSSCSQMFYKIFAKCARKHLFWSHFLTKLQVSKPTKRLKHRYFWVNFSQFLEKCYLQNTSTWLPTLIPLFQTKFYALIKLCSFFHIFFPFNIDNYNYRSLLRKCIKMNKKIQLGKPALNNFKAYKWQKWKT